MNRTVQRLTLMTLTSVGLAVVVPRFLAACAPPPAAKWESLCPSDVDCWTSDDPQIGEELNVRCDVEFPDRNADNYRLTEAQLFRTFALTSVPQELDEVDTLDRPRSVSLYVEVPDESDWAELTVKLSYGEDCDEYEESLGAFELLPATP